jgi:hypothetical protein
MAGTRHSTASADALLVLVVSPMAGAVIGGALGLTLTWPDAFTLFIGYIGALVGAVAGPVSVVAGLGMHGATRRLSHRAVRRALVSVGAAVGAAATVWALLARPDVLGSGPYVLAAFILGGASAAVVYSRLDGRCVPSTVHPAALPTR